MQRKSRHSTWRQPTHALTSENSSVLCTCVGWIFWQLEGAGRILESAEGEDDPLNVLKDVLVEYYKKRSETQVCGLGYT